MNACQLRSLNVPPGSDQERRTIIADELAEDWAELRNPMEFDFWETEPGKTEKGTDSFNVNVLATSRQWISQIWRDCRKSGLDCWAIDGLPLAMARTIGLVGGLSGGKRALVVDGAENAALQRSIRNLSGSDFLATQGLNVYDILGHEYLVLTADSARKVEEALS
jgi:hypothetical protein